MMKDNTVIKPNGDDVFDSEVGVGSCRRCVVIAAATATADVARLSTHDQRTLSFSKTPAAPDGEAEVETGGCEGEQQAPGLILTHPAEN